MTKRKNEFGIKCLLMYPAFQIVDPATQAALQLKATVEFFPGAFLPEFVEVQNSIRQQFEKQKMTLDAAAGALVDFFNEFEPEGVKVKVEVINNNVFFTVAAIAESGNCTGCCGSVEDRKKSVEKASANHTGGGIDPGKQEGTEQEQEDEDDEEDDEDTEDDR